MFLYSWKTIPPAIIMGKRGPKQKFMDIPCPNEHCKAYGKTGLGNIVANGTYQIKSGRVRKYICHTCSKSFSDRTNTAFYDLRTEEEKVILALKMVLKEMTLRGIADVLGIKLDTVRGWLKRAAQQSEEINKVLMKDLKVSKVELDELWTFVKKKQLLIWRKKIRKNAGSG